jgi:hypothetical protein
MNMSNTEHKDYKKKIREAILGEDKGYIDSVIEKRLKPFKNASEVLFFDIEFAHIKGKKEIVEIGLAYYNRNNQYCSSQHITIINHAFQYSRPSTPMEHSLMFAYGKSLFLTLNDAMQMLREMSEDADISVVYNGRDKRKFLDANGCENLKYINLNTLFQYKLMRSNQPSFSEAITAHNILEQPMNNGGNDAAMTALLFTKMFGKDTGIKADPEVKKDFSCHEKKRSSENIQILRRLHSQKEKLEKQKNNKLKNRF